MTVTISKMSSAAIALNRFGLGAQAQNALPADPKKWLIDQLLVYEAKPAAWATQANTKALLADIAAQKLKKAQFDEVAKKAANKRIADEARSEYFSAVNRRVDSALTTNTPFVERLVHFWANHFAISADKAGLNDLAGAYELEAIRPHVLGNFKDMLFAVEKHPAMLIYLDQTKSVGPNSKSGRFSQKKTPDKLRGLNENLAREILELHTLGVRGGYSQNDVTEFARAMTGWRVDEGKSNQAPMQNKSNTGKKIKDIDSPTPSINGFVFQPAVHEPGSRTILGKTYAQSGIEQAEAVLTDLAKHAATATFIATKLARHFVSDNPPASLIDKLSAAYSQNNGNLTAVYTVLINAEESWQPAPAKFKTPWEWLISALRGIGKPDLKNLNIGQMLNQLGQSVWKPRSPAGFDDIAATWAAPNALLRRVEMAQRLAGNMGDKVDARALADKLLVGSISAETKTAIERAESATTALALLLVCPEFLRR